MKKKSISDFFKYFVINLMNKYGSFMWIGTHVGMTQVNWHWVLEIFLCIIVNILMVIAIYWEWSQQKIN